MAKVTAPATSKSAKSSKSVAAKGKAVAKAPRTERESNLQYRFVKASKDEINPETVAGCVYHGIKAIKSGNLDACTAATVKAGFGKVSNQDPREKTRIVLRNLANDGFVEITRANGAAKTAKKAAKGDKGKKSFKLVK